MHPSKQPTSKDRLMDIDFGSLLDIGVTKTYDVGGKGRKECPSCHKFVGARNHNCACGHEFITGESMGGKKKDVDQLDPKLQLFAARMGFRGSGICYAPSLDRVKLKTELVSLDYNGICEFCDTVIDEYGNESNTLLGPEGLKYLGRYYLELRDENLEFFNAGVDEWYANIIAEYE